MTWEWCPKVLRLELPLNLNNFMNGANEKFIGIYTESSCTWSGC